MPLSPRCAATNCTTCRLPARGLMASRRLGRSKPCTKTRGASGKSRAATSARVAARREGDDLHAAELAVERCEIHVFGAEVVAPLRDAMRLVDRHEAHAGA